MFEPSIQELQELKLFSHKSSFYIMVFNEKYAKLKLLMLIPLLKLVLCFSISDYIVSVEKLVGSDITIFSAVNDAKEN